MKGKEKKKSKKNFKVGDKIIDFGQICRIFKISQKKGSGGKRKKVIHFRHYFKTPQNRDAVYSIPVKNIRKTYIRRPVSKRELEGLIKKLSREPKETCSFSAARVKDSLNKNDVHKTARVLKSLWLEKNDESTSFTKAKKEMFELAMKRLLEEVAFVKKISVSEARKIIRESLKKLKKSYAKD